MDKFFLKKSFFFGGGGEEVYIYFLRNNEILSHSLRIDSDFFFFFNFILPLFRIILRCRLLIVSAKKKKTLFTYDTPQLRPSLQGSVMGYGKCDTNMAHN